MKIAVCLFLFCLGLILADLAEGYAKANKDVSNYVHNVNKLALDRKKLVTKLGKQRKSKLLFLAKNSGNKIKSLVKHSNNYESLTQRALAAEKVTITSAELILKLVNQTVDGLRKSLKEAGMTLTEFTKLYLKNVKEYGDKCLLKIVNVLKKKDVASAKKIFKNELNLISTITETSSRRLTEVVSTSSKSVSDLNHSGGILVLETADNQTLKLQNFKAPNERLQKFIKFASDKIYELAKRSADKYDEFVHDIMKRLKELAKKSDSALKGLAQVELKTGIEIIEYALTPKPIAPTTESPWIEAEEKYEKDFNALMDTIDAKSAKILQDAITTVKEIHACKDDKNCEAGTMLETDQGLYLQTVRPNAERRSRHSK